jgi:hypothetical protein
VRAGSEDAGPARAAEGPSGTTGAAGGKEAMGRPSQVPENGKGAQTASQPGQSQVTLSTIRDVSIAATNALGGTSTAPRWIRWLALLGFMILLYVASSLVTMCTLTSKPRIQAFYTPLFAVTVATLVFWRRQVWKFRLKDRKFQEKDRENALNSLAHETANGANAIRANLTAFREANPHAITDEHLQQVERALARIDAALEISAAQPQHK